MTYNTEGKKIQWVETDQKTTQMIELVSRSIKSYNYIPYVQEARERPNMLNRDTEDVKRSK